MGDKLTDWINEQLHYKRWSQSELAKRSGASRPLVSQVLSGDMPPSADFCIKVAAALGESPEKVLRLAGILPPAPAPNDNPTLQEIVELAQNLPPDIQKEILDFVRWQYQRSKT